jgi:2',3'-cyclic-nucleotide 2'-phosphodiesterase / 3'-nucleotidase
MNSLKNPGGGGNRFKNKPVTKEILTDMTELLAEYIQRHGRIEAVCNNN